MKKAADLRAHLAQWVPDLKRNPEKLSLFVEKGHIACKIGQSLSFRYDYTLQILITDFAEPLDVLSVPLLAWIEHHQRELLLDPERRDKAISFEAEVLDNEKTDIAISLALSERVKVESTAAGFACTHLDEPAMPDLTGPLNWQIYLKGEPLA